MAPLLLSPGASGAIALIEAQINTDVNVDNVGAISLGIVAVSTAVHRHSNANLAAGF